ncbi:hypothetical protein BG000_005965 [Podila horticola]|nr:hypothetical protein BG003_007274 [Podila horticola]KAG0336967.1 hypothetical protein BG000_005965 [Podila horticola]
MSCDLTDPAILEAHQAIVSGTPTNWLILGYHDTRDKISLYNKGSGGIDELRANLKDEVLYGFVRIDDRYALLAYVSEHVSGLRRARALVHGKAVGALFKNNHVQINSSNLADFTEDKIRARMGLIEGPPTPDPSNSPVMPSSPVQTPDPRPATPTSPAPNNATGYTEITSPRSGASTPRTERQLEIEAAERRVREETERQKRSEIAKRQKETQEREAREQALQAQKQAQELERQRKDESDRLARESMKKHLIEQERLRGSGLSGYITIQTAGSPYWRRRFYVMRGQIMALYRDEDPRRGPGSELRLGGRVTNIQDASLDVLIPHSFRVDMYNGDTHLFFCDTARDKELAIAGFMKCNESA